MENLKTAKNLIDKAENISILSCPEFQKDSFPASLALFYSLKKIGKNVNFLLDNHPDRFAFLLKDEPLYSSKADFVISVKETGTKLSGFFYEKTDTGLNIFLKTLNKNLKQEDVSLKPMLDEKAKEKPETLLISIGVEKFATVKEYAIEPTPSIINIDIKKANEEYGNVNIIDSLRSSFSEIIFDLICHIEENPFDEQIAQSLLTGIIFAYHNLQNPKLSPDVLHKLACLAENGASVSKIRDKLYGSITKNSLAMFARILNKIRIGQETGTAYALLNLKDFKETMSAPADLKFALRKLTSGLFPFENLLVLWEQESSPILIRGVFYSSKTAKLKNILENFKGKQKGDAIIFNTEETELETAKNLIIDLVK